MENKQRSDPDQLLKQIQQEDEILNRRRGYLKVFLGYIAGVGKTYRMLNEAHTLLKNGTEVWSGIVETHNRQETMTLLAGIPQIPLKEIEYHGITLKELDLETILQRKPKYVLVDELAHTNVPGSHNNKRYQDVEELLENGISVYTTLNIQHLESVKDIVYEITGVEIKETVPDKILERADKIEIIDLPVEELRQRLSEGKVYVPDKALLAAHEFFREGNLLALREMALRYTAKHVDDAMLSYMRIRGIHGPWPADSRLLVCISPSPSSEQPIRVTQRLAEGLKAEWVAVYVESVRLGIVDESRQIQLNKNLQLAQDMGAQIVRLNGFNPAVEILNYAKQNNITLIVIGFSQQSPLQKWLKGSIPTYIIEHSSPVQVLVVGDQQTKEKSIPPSSNISQPIPWKSIINGLSSVAVVTVICFLLQSLLNLTNISLIYLIPIVFSSLTAGVWGGLTASLTAVLCLNYFFVPPVFTFSVYDLKFLPTFLILLFVGLSTSVLAEIIHRQNIASHNRERFISLLYEFSRDLLHAIGLIELLDRCTLDISQMFDCDVILLLPGDDSQITIRSQAGERLTFGEHEQTIADWSYKHGKPSGRNTDTFSSSPYKYLPLIGKNKILGVLAIGRPLHTSFLTMEEHHLLESFTGVVSLSIENYLSSKIIKEQKG